MDSHDDLVLDARLDALERRVPPGHYVDGDGVGPGPDLVLLDESVNTLSPGLSVRRTVSQPLRQCSDL